VEFTYPKKLYIGRIIAPAPTGKTEVLATLASTSKEKLLESYPVARDD
jgi:hypothetical protein